MTKEVGLPLQFWWPGPEIPLDRFAGNFQIVEKFKKVFLDVLDRSLREMVVIDEPVELASATWIESNFDRRLWSRCCINRSCRWSRRLRRWCWWR